MNAAGLITTGIRASAASCTQLIISRLVVGLPDVHVQAEGTAGRAAQVGQGVERHRAVDLRFPDAEAAEVRAVEHEHLRDHVDTSW